MTEPSTGRKNKTQIKRDVAVLHDLGKQLVDAGSLIDNLPISEKLLDAILLARTIKKAALKRQLKFIGSLIQHEDINSIKQALIAKHRAQHRETQDFHKIEQWRDQLLEGDDTLLNNIVMQHKNADRQHIRQLIRNNTKEIKLKKAPKSSRELFRYLQKIC